MFQIPCKQNLALLLLSTVLVVSCSDAPPPTPVCRVSDAHVDDAMGNAGCIIRVNDKLVTIGHRQTGALDIPGGTANEGEQSQCTAHRETFEETGFNVEVGKLLGVAKNGFRFYQCDLSNGLDTDIEIYPVPDWAGIEVAYIKRTDPFDTLASEWRYPGRYFDILKWFNETKVESEEDK